ncbi:MAG: hemagglutinin/hemolysin-related protein [Labilithrix sp.]|nr:hemagglutinin/hemolysin-related protein [Labilithrix sp.]
MKPTSFVTGAASALALVLALPLACGGSKGRNTFDDGDAGNGGFGGGDGGIIGSDDGGNGGIGGRDPVTCAEAQQFKTYVGCDYYPTVTANLVQSIFDFAVVVANNGSTTANVTVTGPNGTNQSATVAGGSLTKIFLPWVPALKGSERDSLTQSALVKGGAYHLVSDVPVVVYQFSPLEYQATGGPPGKDWSSCVQADPFADACYSYSNDASLLLPSTAMTGNYRIMGSQGMSRSSTGDYMPPYFVVTGTQDGTTVTVNLPAKGKVVAGSGIAAAAGGTTMTFTLDAGDVAQIVSGLGRNFDLSGGLLKADKPVQVITGVPCIDFPFDVEACDHIEETVFPVETLGKHYVVVRPSSPKAQVGQVVHMYGNVDGTALTYKPSRPSSCPDFLNAGQVADCGEVTQDFEVTGDHEFGIGTFQVGGAEVDPDNATGPLGDPSQSFAVTVEQFRKDYVFLAPPDYQYNYVDIVGTAGTTLTLDGKDVSGQLKAISGTGFHAAHVQLGTGSEGAHTLKASAPIGIQVLGYGANTTYQYPGGLNLSTISAVPVK